MYHYLTGAASWYMLTVITEMFGVHGELGNLVFTPRLLAEQFDKNGEAALTLQFGGKRWHILYQNESGTEYGEYQITKMLLDEKEIPVGENAASVCIPKEQLDALRTEMLHEVMIYLG